MPRREHSSEDLAQDLSEWVERTAQQLASAMYEGDAAPGSAVLTKAEQLDYYHGMLYLPDGSPNIPGRQVFVTSIGPLEQKNVTEALLRRRADRRKEEASFG